MLGVFCVILGVGTFLLAIYIIPYLWFDWSYPLPQMIIAWRRWLESKAVWEPFFQVILIVVPIVVLSVGLFFSALNITRKMEARVAERLHDHIGQASESGERLFQEEAKPKNLPVEQSRYFAAKLLFIMLVTLAVVLFVIEIILT